ncbi:MAG TPA: type II toxin-antitoxin system PemK/MazF family toxin [Candidatus Kapabacteria bacterium]|nr:type II toxin-antitoxin system PemK/MazF family toxin [Candidatus Kapabacteria bacterium]
MAMVRERSQVALDQIRCVDKARLIKKLGVIDTVSVDARFFKLTIVLS